ncbi:MAG: ABC transporter permease [Eubacteriales bacterium]|nr:ABC transporter permease [Eubacteriales bacterium]MDD3110053.1 ABC transporter permease [Eubacteriales bacterium]
MHDFLTVFRYELKTQLTKKTAIITTVILMIVVLAAASLPRIISLFETAAPADSPSAAISDAGYVLPGGEPDALLAPALGDDPASFFAGREALIQALVDKEIQVGFVIKDNLDYEAIYLDRSMEDSRDSQMGSLLSQLKKQQLIAHLGITPVDLAAIEAAQAQGVTTVLGRNSMNNYAISFVLMLLVYMMVLLYGNSVSTIIAREKDSRTMEILITSTRPSSLILGKVAAAGLAAVIQFGAVILAAVAGYQFNKPLYPEIITAMLSGTLTTGYVLSYAFFSFIGFILYLFLFAALGSTVSKMEDLGSATALVQFLFIFGYLIATFAANMPGSAVAVIGSIVPFTSIMVMPLRSAVMTVPWGELLLAGALMLLFVAFFAFLSIKIYRWGSLNYGNKTRLSRIVKEALRGH